MLVSSRTEKQTSQQEKSVKDKGNGQHLGKAKPAHLQFNPPCKGSADPPPAGTGDGEHNAQHSGDGKSCRTEGLVTGGTQLSTHTNTHRMEEVETHNRGMTI
ncbi:hypothetical protein ILYODFUR_030585 [Ilyodon furcidens]|uniref:Uncharacterized protein n=1 Tax=Ilyodon furcidens TaxID=33524 RepID=A0ABV0UWU2_9TELE